MKRLVVILTLACACLSAAQDIDVISVNAKEIDIDVPVEKPVTTKAPAKSAMDEVTVAEVAKATRKVAKGEFVTARQVQAKIARALARTSKTSPNYKWLRQLERELKDALNNFRAESLANKTSRELVKKHEWRLNTHGKLIHKLEADDRNLDGRLDNLDDRLRSVEDRPAETITQQEGSSTIALWLSIAALVVALAAIGLGLAGKIKLPTRPRNAPAPPVDNRKAWEADSLAEAWDKYKNIYPVEAQTIQNGDPAAIPGFNDFLVRQYADIPDDIFGQPLKDVIDANPV